MYAIELTPEAADDLRALKPYYRRRIVTSINTQLRHTPMIQTKHRKPLGEMVLPWQSSLPVWQLSVGSYRVLYDTSEVDQLVTIRAIRLKPHGKRTEDML